MSVNLRGNSKGGDMSQKDDILFHLQEYGSITPMEALNEHGCFRLASRIHDLKSDGITIEVSMVNKYATYFIKKLDKIQ